MRMLRLARTVGPWWIGVPLSTPIISNNTCLGIWSPMSPCWGIQVQWGRRLSQAHSSLIQSLSGCTGDVGTVDVNVETHQCHCPPLKSTGWKGVHWLGPRQKYPILLCGWSPILQWCSVWSLTIQLTLVFLFFFWVGKRGNASCTVTPMALYVGLRLWPASGPICPSDIMPSQPTH